MKRQYFYCFSIFKNGKARSVGNGYFDTKNSFNIIKELTLYLSSELKIEYSDIVVTSLCELRK